MGDGTRQEDVAIRNSSLVDELLLTTSLSMPFGKLFLPLRLARGGDILDPHLTLTFFDIHC